MRITDRQVDARAGVGRKSSPIPLAITQSIASRAYLVARPSVPFYLRALRVSCVSYTATITIDLVLAGATERLTAPTLTIHSTPEQFAIGAFRARVAGRFVEKAAATALTFTAAHVVTAETFGVILVQMSNAGTVSTKVPSATQAYATAALAVAALSSADTGNVAIGYITIAADAGNWTANTDDLTNASDLTSATFTALAASVTSALSATIAPVAQDCVEATLSTVPARVRDSSGLKDIVALVTTDGSAVIGSGVLEAVWTGTR